MIRIGSIVLRVDDLQRQTEFWEAALGYRQHYNEHRPHRALRLLPPNGRNPTPLNAAARVRRRDLLGGLIHEYEAA